MTIEQLCKTLADLGHESQAGFFYGRWTVSVPVDPRELFEITNLISEQLKEKGVDVDGVYSPASRLAWVNCFPKS